MKTKVLLIAVITVLSVSLANAQKIPFQKGSNVFSGGIYFDFGHGYLGESVYYSNRYEWYHFSSSPKIVLSFDHGITNKIGIGFISVGGQFGNYWLRIQNPDPYVYYSPAFVMHGNVRALYHFDFWSITKQPFFSRFDVYAGPYAGVAIRVLTITDTNPNPDTSQSYNTAGGLFGIIAGARYNFTKKFGAYVEANIEGNAGVGFGLSALF